MSQGAEVISIMGRDQATVPALQPMTRAVLQQCASVQLELHSRPDGFNPWRRELLLGVGMVAMNEYLDPFTVCFVPTHMVEVRHGRSESQPLIAGPKVYSQSPELVAGRGEWQIIVRPDTGEFHRLMAEESHRSAALLESPPAGPTRVAGV